MLTTVIDLNDFGENFWTDTFCLADAKIKCFEVTRTSAHKIYKIIVIRCAEHQYELNYQKFFKDTFTQG